MIQRWIDDFKSETSTVVRLSALATAAAIALAIATGFLCAALFVLVYQHHGPIIACLAGAALFFVVTLISAACYWSIKRSRRMAAAKAAEEAKAAARSTARTVLNDPATLAIALQAARLIGVKRLLPLLAVGGLAFGIYAAKNARADSNDRGDSYSGA